MENLPLPCNTLSHRNTHSKINSIVKANNINPVLKAEYFLLKQRFKINILNNKTSIEGKIYR